uniref:Uncharacterized protein n=1 Tax=Peronospora matthiolae TaxID=2874970 RepID=A0AAV1TSW7_9STRA
MPTSTRAASWRVGERQAPRARRALAWRTLKKDELHPLSTAYVSAAETGASGPLCASFPRQDAGVKPIRTREALPELVGLHEEDADPAGGIVLSTDGKKSRSGPSDVSVELVLDVIKMEETRDTSGAGTVLRTVKKQWKEQDREKLLAGCFHDVSRVEEKVLDVKKREHERVWGRRSDWFSTEKTDERTETATLIEKTRKRLLKMERGRHRKVEALRIAIKCVKLLADTTTAPQLYPCVFVLVTDVLDAFGQLVYDRIYAQASGEENGQPLSEPLGERFRRSDVNVQAVETCRNWFYKSACIRELLPRIYIEVALLGCYRFLCDDEYPQIVARLSNMIKGVGDPMVALYARLYLSLASSELVGVTSSAGHIVIASSSLFDYFYAFDWFRQHKLGHWLLTNKMRYEEYLALHSPAVKWLIKCAAPKATQDTFDSLLAHYRKYVDNSMVLKHICEYFSAQFYAATPSVMVDLIRTASPSLVSKCHLYSTLATQLSKTTSIAANEPGGKLQFLNSSWSFITSQEDVAQYVECAAAYMKLIVVHFSHREALILLKDVVRHLDAATPEELTPRSYNRLGTLIENVVFGAKQSYEFFSKLIPSSAFLTIMGMFKRESSVDVARKVLRAFVSGELKKASNRLGTLRLHIVGPEAAVTHALMTVCCRVHDALDSLSTVSERTEATRDISAFVTRLGYVNEYTTVSERAQGAEQEALLMLYTDCRRAFYKLEQIGMLLSTMVLRLAMYSYKRVCRSVRSSKFQSKKHAHVRRGFIQSCLAFAHITIPSVEASLEKIQLMVLAANVALVTGCVPQMDALVKAAIMLLADLDIDALQLAGNCDENVHHQSEPESISSTSSVISQVLQTIAHLVNVLVYAPSLNDEDAFYFVNALRKAVLERMKWMPRNPSSLSHGLEAGVARVRVSLMLIQVYALWGQQSLPDRLNGVDSNDVLYGGEDAFYDEVQAHFSSIIEEIVQGIDALGELSEDNGNVDRTVAERVTVAQVELMLDFINLVAPVLECDDGRLGAALTTSDSFREDGIAETSHSDSRRRKKPRSGLALVRKCMTYSYEKARLLKQVELRGAATTEVQMASTACHYFDSTRAYIIDFMLETSKRIASMYPEASSQQSIQSLVEALEQFTL